MTARARLQEGLGVLSSEHPDLGFSKIDTKLLDYLDLLNRWNSKFNLTAIKDGYEQVSKHLLDSLAVVPYLSSGSLIDVGTGAGLPGVPIAVVCPQKSVTLLDSNGKKTRFLLEVKARLKLDNVCVINTRVEDFRSEIFDELVCRAFCPLSELLMKVKHLVNKEGKVLAMLGQKPSAQELADLPAGAWSLDELHVPLLRDARHLISLRAHG